MFVQLVEATNVSLARRHGWDADRLRLDPAWFESAETWNIRRLHKAG